MVFVYIEAEGTESSIHTVQAIHIAFALVTTGMNLALTEETCLQKWTEPRWPLPAIFTSKFTLFQINKTQNSITIMNKSNYTYTHIHILDKPWFLGINGLEEIKKKRTNREKKEDGGGEVSSVLYWSGWGKWVVLIWPRKSTIEPASERKPIIQGTEVFTFHSWSLNFNKICNCVN